MPFAPGFIGAVPPMFPDIIFCMAGRICSCI